MLSLAKSEDCKGDRGKSHLLRATKARFGVGTLNASPLYQKLLGKHVAV